MILGISASGRPTEKNSMGTLTKGVTEEMVKYILRNTGEAFEYVSLNGKKILGCQGCLKCAGNNVCVLEDDWATIRDMMIEAEAVVFGAPVYYGAINSLGHAFLERTFSLRHRESFKLTGKPNVIVTAGTEQSNPAEDYIRTIFRTNYMTSPVGTLRVRGVSQCLTCGYGQSCAAGGVVGRFGYLDEIKDEHFSRIPEETYRRANIIAKRLGSIVRSNR
jgi:multimeric flavodoxin WrbA